MTISVVPTSFGFVDRLDFNEVGVDIVGVDKGQDLYNAALRYGEKFYQEEHQSALGYFDLEKYKNKTPWEAISSETQDIATYRETIESQIHIRQVADNYRIMGVMQLEQYKTLFKKYKSQVTNFNIRDLSKKALSQVVKTKFLAK